MGLRDFFKAVRERKQAASQSLVNANNLSDEEIAANWVKCKACNTTIYKSDYCKNLNICNECGYHGRINIDERIEILLDPNTLKEQDKDLKPKDPLNFNDGRPYPEVVAKAQAKTGYQEALVTGKAQMNGINVAIAIMNFDFLGGSMGSVVGEKFTRLIETAIKEKLPVISVACSGGARMHEGILSLMQMAKTSIALEKLSKAGLLYISILTDPTYGGVSASFATLGDLIIAEPGARVGFAGRRVIEETVREKLPEDFQTAEYLLEHGQIDLIIDRREMKSTLVGILQAHNYLPKNFKAPNSASALITNNKIAVEQPRKEIALDFEKPLVKIQEEIKTLEKKADKASDINLINKLKEQYKIVERSIYQNLTAIDITRIARHPNRPNCEDTLNMLCGNKWMELHGDRAGADDQAILTALAEIDGKAFIASFQEMDRQWLCSLNPVLSRRVAESW